MVLETSATMAILQQQTTTKKGEAREQAKGRSPESKQMGQA